MDLCGTCGHLVVLDWLGHDSWFVMHLLRQSMSENVLTSLFGGKMCFGCLFFMLSEAELALLDAFVCPNALALWGALRPMMLVLADAGACELCYGCLCLLAQFFCTEQLACDPLHFFIVAFVPSVFVVVPVLLTYIMVQKWLIRNEPYHTINWCCVGFGINTYVPF
jgi:hypothetical protein